MPTHCQHLMTEEVCLYFVSKYFTFEAFGISTLEKNATLISELNLLINAIRVNNQMDFVHVEDHSKSEWNDLADYSAKRGGMWEI